ncbi:MAG: glycosyltransferase family 2 protein [Bacteroidota bacterium]
MDLSIIIVSFNTRELLRTCLDSLRAHPSSLVWEIVVVDNGSSDGSADLVEQTYRDVRLIRNSANLGFAAANNIGIRNSTGKYVLLLNSDTEMPASACDDVVRFLKSRGEIGLAGCTLRNPDGSLQPSVRSFPSVINLISESFFLYRIFPRSSLFGRYYMTNFDYSKPGQVDWVMGAFLMIHRGVFETIGLLDERFFMFGEEADLCYRAKQAGMATWFFPGVNVVHHWGSSSKNGYQRVLWTKGSQLLYFQKHFAGPSRYTLFILLMIGMLLRVPLYLLRGMFFWRREFTLDAYYYARALITLPFHFVNGSIYPINVVQR